MELPEELRGRAFTRAQANDLGISDQRLKGPQFVRMHRGVYRCVTTVETFHVMAAAALLALPAGCALSHTTALRVFGLEMGLASPIHCATDQEWRVRRPGVVLHRFEHQLVRTTLRGLTVVEPYRTFVDCATLLSPARLLAVGDWLSARGLILEERLCEFVAAVHFDGVRRARRVAPLVDRRSASPQESVLRWILVRAGLPEPEVNADIYDDWGTWLARGDLVFRRWKVLVEYDGIHHERDPVQRQSDHLRLERLQAAGWRVVVITAVDLRNARAVVIRIRQVLRQAGCAC